ncbi:hypothetical protein, partial [Staphylococcus aureus]
NLNATTGITAGAEVVSNIGAFRAKASSSSNAHLRFQGEEVSTSKNYERAILYADSQTASSGQIALRVQNGSASDSGNAV